MDFTHYSFLIMLLSVKFGVRLVLWRTSPVIGLVVRPILIHFSIAFLSYVCPSLSTTGSLINSWVMGHLNS